MGRPALKVKQTMVRLPEGIPERIDALVGNYRRAQFIREAVAEKIEKAERRQAKGEDNGNAS
jgi:predicted DNA-binding protein